MPKRRERSDIMWCAGHDGGAAPHCYIQNPNWFMLVAYAIGRIGGCGTASNCTKLGLQSSEVKRTIAPLFPLQK